MRPVVPPCEKSPQDIDEQRRDQERQQENLSRNLCIRMEVQMPHGMNTVEHSRAM